MLGGSKREWLIVLGAVVLGAGLLLFTRGRPFGVSDRVTVKITLITADRGDLDCALDQEVSGLRCAFLGNTTAVSPPPPPEQLLAPYMTPDRRMLLVPALFEEPALQARYDRERPVGRPKHRLKRFVATCQVHLLTKVPKLKVRFGKRSNWGDATDAWVAKPESCTVAD